MENIAIQAQYRNLRLVHESLCMKFVTLGIVHLVTTRHETKGCEGVTANIARAMAGFAKQATQ